jgi:hypothetical protein
MTLGFYQQDFNGHEAIAHGGDTVRYHSDVVLMPKQGLGLFLSFISDDSTVREEVETAFFARYFPRESEGPPRLDDTIARLLAAKYSGAYEWTVRNHSDFERLFNLDQSVDVAPLGNGNLIVTGIAKEPVQFEPIASDLYRDVLGKELQMAFRSDEAAQPTHLFLSSHPYMPAERTPWYDLALLWEPVLGVAFLLLLAPLSSLYYRWPEIKLMPVPQQRAIAASAGTGAWGLLTALALAWVLKSTPRDVLLAHIPTSLTLALAMPLIFVGLTLWLIVTTVQAWRQQYWTAGRRITYSLTLPGALLACAFLWQWRLLGWNFG